VNAARKNLLVVNTVRSYVMVFIQAILG